MHTSQFHCTATPEKWYVVNGPELLRISLLLIWLKSCTKDFHKDFCKQCSQPKFNLGTCSSSCRFKLWSKILSVINNPECQVQTGTKLVDKKIRVIKWKVSYPVSTTDDDAGRCFSDWVGVVCEGKMTKGTWSTKGQKWKWHINILELLKVELESFTGYLRQTLVFMWNSVLREKLNFYFEGVFG